MPLLRRYGKSYNGKMLGVYQATVKNIVDGDTIDVRVHLRNTSDPGFGTTFSMQIDVRLRLLASSARTLPSGEVEHALHSYRDGDEVKTKETPNIFKMFYLQYNTPELRGEERDAGLAATSMLKWRAPVGSEIMIVTWGKGKYGRYLATPYTKIGPWYESLLDDRYVIAQPNKEEKTNGSSEVQGRPASRRDKAGDT